MSEGFVSGERVTSRGVISAAGHAWHAYVRGFLRSTSTPWLLASVAVTVVSWGLGLGGIGSYLLGRGVVGFGPYFAMDVAIALVYGGVVLLMLPRSRHPVVWIVVASALGCGASGFLSAFLELAGSEQPSRFLVNMLGWTWVPGTYCAMAVLPWLLVPGRPIPRAAKVIAALALIPIAWRVVSVAFGPRLVADHAWDIAPEWFQDIDRWLGPWPDRSVTLLSFAGVLRLLWVWRTAAGDRGRGFGWLAIGQAFLAVAFLPVVFTMPMPLARIAYDFSAASLIAAQPFLVGALLVVVLGHRMWGIDTTVNRATVWLLLSGVLVASYLLVAWLVQRQLSVTAAVAQTVSVGALLIVSQPLRSWLQGRVDLLVYGPAIDPGRLLTSLRVVGGSTASDQRLQELVTSLAESLRLGRIEVRSAEGELLVNAGRNIETQYEVPLVVDGRPGGSLAVAAYPGQNLDARTRRLIEQTAGVIGVFVELSLAHERLDAATSRLIEVRHEERRMLRRDLHDGMGPALAGVGLGLVAVRKKLDRDPDGAAQLLNELADEIGHRTEDVRLLARALLPAALDDGDLEGALHVLGDRFRSAGLSVAVDTSDLQELETRRQIAIYHVSAEGVLNAHRHAKARTVHIRVTGSAGAPATVDIVDDGVGIGSRPVHGIGLTSMQERADELSGTLTVAADPGGGTRVTMVLP